MLLAKELSKHGRLPQALKEVEFSLDMNPEFVEAHYVKGLIQFRTGDLEGASKTFTIAVELRGDYVDVWIALCLVKTELGEYNDALSAIAEAIRCDHKNANAYLLQGNILMAQNRLSDASLSYQAALDNNPMLTVARYKLGHVLTQLGRETEAEAQVVRALRLNPMDASSRILLGDLLLSRGKPEEAAKEYLAAVKLDQQPSAMAQGKLGMAWLKAGWIREAMGAFQMAIRMDQRQCSSYVNLAQCYLLVDQPDDAIEILNLAKDLDPSNPRIDYLLQDAQTRRSNR
ncbi:MAG: tetratricopeptide repeat protein [Methylococcales bacterium]